ncbi:MAG: signal recognition particle-docking protein FtsY [Halanaerobiaceae bacterium]
MNIFGRNKDEEKKVESKQNEGNTETEKEEKGFFTRLKDGLSKTRKGFVNKLGNLFSGYSAISDELFEELEELLIQADVGINTTMQLVEDLREQARNEDIENPEELFSVFQEEIIEILKKDYSKLELESGLNIIIVVGVNGVGKTTTMAKIARRFKEQGKKVMFAAGDTFRAGAIDQIEVWGNRLGINVISQKEGSDAAAVAYDAVQAAQSRDVDLLIVDTAGRLHTQKNLMEELKKVKRVITREAENAHTETLLVLDATTGQNAVSQAELFDEAVDVDGIALTKLDGTAKGGIVIAIKNEMGIPIKLIGVGEDAEDLQDFQPEQFVEALFSEDD